MCAVSAMLTGSRSKMEQFSLSRLLTVEVATASEQRRSLESQMLEKRGLYVDAARALGEPGNLCSWEERRRARLLEAAGEHAEALSACKHALTSESGDLIAASHAAKICLQYDYDDVESLIERFTATGTARLLARAEVARLRVEQHPSDDNASELRSRIHLAFEELGSHTSSFASDVRPLVRSLCNVCPSEASKLEQLLIDEIKELSFVAQSCESSEGAEHAAMRNVRHVCNGYAVARELRLRRPASLKEARAEADRLMKLYKNSMHLWQNLKDPREPSSADGFVIMAADEMLECVHSGAADECSARALLEAAAVLEEGLIESPHHPWMHTRLLHIYCLLGSSIHFDDAFEMLDMKNFLLESMSHHFVCSSLSCGDTSRMLGLARSVIEFHTEHEHSTPDSIRTAFSWGNISKAAEFARFSEKMRSSHLYMQCLAELASNDVFGLSAPSASVLAGQELPRGTFLASEDEIHNRDAYTMFTHDFATRSRSTPPPSGCPSLLSWEWWRSCGGHEVNNSSLLWWKAHECESVFDIPFRQQERWKWSLRRGWLVASAAHALRNDNFLLVDRIQEALADWSSRVENTEHANGLLAKVAYAGVRVAAQVPKHIQQPRNDEEAQSASHRNSGKSGVEMDPPSDSLKSALETLSTHISEACKDAASGIIVWSAEAEGDSRKSIQKVQLGFAHRLAYETGGLLSVLAQWSAGKMRGSAKAMMKAGGLNVEISSTLRQCAKALDEIDAACQTAPVGKTKKCAAALAPSPLDDREEHWLGAEHFQRARRKAADGLAASLSALSKLAISRSKALRDSANALSK